MRFYLSITEKLNLLPVFFKINNKTETKCEVSVKKSNVCTLKAHL